MRTSAKDRGRRRRRFLSNEKGRRSNIEKAIMWRMPKRTVRLGEIKKVTRLTRVAAAKILATRMRRRRKWRIELVEKFWSERENEKPTKKRKVMAVSRARIIRGRENGSGPLSPRKKASKKK